MLGGKRLASTFRRWIASFGATLAVVAQLTVALSPLVESRDASTAAHVEPWGQSTHYAHNDADCGVCQARVHQGMPGRAAELPLADALLAPTLVAAVERLVTLDTFSPASPRAPPVS